MFTTKFTKGAKGGAKPFAKKFAEGGTVPLPEDDPRSEYRRGQRQMDYESQGSSNRTVGEHIKAMGRAIFEPKEFREVYESGGKRDRKNPLYDRKKFDED